MSPARLFFFFLSEELDELDSLDEDELESDELDEELFLCNFMKLQTAGTLNKTT